MRLRNYLFRTWIIYSSLNQNLFILSLFLIRAETRTVLNTPNFLLVSIVVDAVETEEDISAIEFQSMGQAQYSIDFGGSKYSLKQVVVSSSTRMGYGHYCGIIVINGRLIFYDGIPSNNPQLRFISPEQRFGTLLHGGFISALVYMKLTPDCEFFLDPTTLKYGGYGSDDADPELEDCEESSAEDLVKALKMIATKCMKVQNRSKSSKVVSANNNHSSTKDLNTTKESNELAAKKLVEKNKVVDEKELVKPDFLSMWNDTAGPADKAGSPVVLAHKKNILKKAQSNSRSKKAKTEQGSPFAQKKKVSTVHQLVCFGALQFNQILSHQSLRRRNAASLQNQNMFPLELEWEVKEESILRDCLLHRLQKVQRYRRADCAVI